jgi:dipeptidase
MSPSTSNLIISLVCYIAIFVAPSWACTSIIVSKGAAEEGPMTTHTADCAECDFRISKVPAADWPEGSERVLYQYKSSYPATVVKDRGTTWHPDNLEGTPEQIAAWKEYETSLITGKIPQVPHTYALYEAGYGIMNEHQLAIGESTCASHLVASPTTAGGKARIEVREMSKLALERTKTAREAIQLMGDLATELGYYSAAWVGGDMEKGEGGESLQVIDTKEAWVFHVTSDDTGTSAVWAAQRVPDGDVSTRLQLIRTILAGFFLSSSTLLALTIAHFGIRRSVLCAESLREIRIVT